MSNRSIVELNHDYCPRDDAVELIEWALRMRYYMGNADRAYLPSGVTFLHYRHHSEPSPLAPPQKDKRPDRGYPTWCRNHAEQLIAKAKVAGIDTAEQGSARSDEEPSLSLHARCQDVRRETIEWQKPGAPRAGLWYRMYLRDPERGAGYVFEKDGLELIVPFPLPPVPEGGGS
jgi:hypothetical protein